MFETVYFFAFFLALRFLSVHLGVVFLSDNVLVFSLLYSCYFSCIFFYYCYLGPLFVDYLSVSIFVVSVVVVYSLHEDNKRKFIFEWREWTKKNNNGWKNEREPHATILFWTIQNNTNKNAAVLSLYWYATILRCR